MIRLLVVLIAAAVLAAAIAWLASQQGELLLTVGAYEVHTTAPVAIGLVILFAALIAFLSRLVALLLSGPGAIGAWFAARRMQRGHDAISRGLVAAAAGDKIEVRRYVGRARGILGGHPLALLLTAQAAQLDGDEDAQRRAYRAMLAHEETEFLGLRGLFMLARRDGDAAQAETFASRAHALRPRAQWAINALFDLNSARGEWREALAVLKSAGDIGLIDADIVRRRRAVLLAAEALDIEHRGDSEGALSTALEALSLSPALTPAATLAARKLIAQSKLWRAQDVIEAAWTQAPHPDLADAYAAIVPNEAPAARAARMLDLARLNRDHFESRMLAAEQAILLHDWPEARRVLSPLSQAFASARVCALMAEIEEGQWANASAAHAWLARAARAPRDAEWRCANCGWSSGDWSPVCAGCGGFDTLAWSAPAADVLENLSSVEEHVAATEGEGFLHDPATLPHAPPASRLVRTRRPGGEESKSESNRGEQRFVELPWRPDDPGPGGAEFESDGSMPVGGV
jgi:HemY protein